MNMPADPQPGLGEKRVLPGKHRAGVLMPGKPEPAGRAEHRRTRLTCRWQVDGGAALGALGFSLRTRRFLLHLALLGDQACGGLLLCLP